MKRPDHEKSLLGHLRQVRSPRRHSVSRKAWLDSYTHRQINRLLRRLFKLRTAF
ncbi:MAG: hypothetical protein KTR25_11250 [Myxococcales bacterium]|nr:hypothetical protein [Myxococcales bacterium]